jgi:ubiquitin-like protein Pup
MSDQEQSKRHSSTSAPTEQESHVAAKDTQGLKDDLDALLDEIDNVLEENAAEFVSNYVQKGGE